MILGDRENNEEKRNLLVNPIRNTNNQSCRNTSFVVTLGNVGSHSDNLWYQQ